MKKRSLMRLVSMVFLFLIVLSCSDKDEDNSFPPYRYPIKIRIEGKSGDDKINGIPYVHKAETDQFEVQKSSYTLAVLQTGKPKEQLFLGPLAMQKTDSYNCLIITSTTLASPDYRPSQLTHKLVCAHIFGDTNEHTIISDWEEKSLVYNLCTHIVVDGKTFTATEIDKEGTAVFLVTLDE